MCIKMVICGIIVEGIYSFVGSVYVICGRVMGIVGDISLLVWNIISFYWEYRKSYYFLGVIFIPCQLKTEVIIKKYRFGYH